MLLLMIPIQTDLLDKKKKSFLKQILTPFYKVTWKDSQPYRQIRLPSWMNGLVYTIDYLKKTKNIWMLSLRANFLSTLLRMKPILALVSSFFVMRKNICSVGLSTTFRATLQILEVLASLVSWFYKRWFPFLCLLTWPNPSWTIISGMKIVTNKIIRKLGAIPISKSIP